MPRSCMDVQQKNQSFVLENVSFSELKTLKAACEAHGKAGSSVAQKLAAEINKAMENIQV